MKISINILAKYMLLSCLLLLGACFDGSSSSGSSGGTDDGDDSGGSGPSVPVADHINLPKDADGWTVFTPSPDTYVVYISASGDDATCRSYQTTDVEMGSDPFDPDGAVLPCATYAQAYSLTTDGYPDWILFKRGDSFVDSIQIGTTRSGRSATEPFLVAAYGIAGNIPVIKIGTNIGIDMRRGASFVAYSSLEFYSHTANPGDPDFDGYTGGQAFSGTLDNGYAIKGILLEGCKFRFTKGGVFQKYQGTECGSITIRRCLFEKSYSTTGHASGLYLKETDSVIIQENVFYHNGWLIQNITGDQSDGSLGQATYYNHNMYLTKISNTGISNNLLIEGAAAGLKVTSSIVAGTRNLAVDDNFILGGTIGFNIGNNFNDVSGRFADVSITNNVLTNIGWSRPTNEATAWYTYNDGWNGGQFTGNLLLNQRNIVENINTRGIHFEADLRDVEIGNNVVYNLENGTGIYIVLDSNGNPTNVSGTTIHNNVVDLPSTYNDLASQAYSTSGTISYYSNKYWAGAGAEDFRYLNSTVDFANWQTLSEDTGSAVAPVTFVDSARTIETYQLSQGGAGTIDDFIASAIAQDRYNWDPAYGASVINAYLRGGFTVVP